MKNIEAIIERCAQAVADPKKAIADHKAQTGMGSVGCMPLYTPDEIVHASGMLPIGMWGGMTQLSLAPTVLPAFACSIMQSITELELQGVYDGLSAVLVSVPCDTLKAIGQKWSRPVPCLQFAHPRNVRSDAARVYMRAEYIYLKERLEKTCGVTVTDAALQNSIKIYNEHRALMRKFSNVAAECPEVIDPVIRHTVFKSSFFMLKEEHNELLRDLIAQLRALPKVPWDGIKAVVTGIMLEPPSVIELFKEMNIAIVADDLGQESRQYRVDAPEDSDPYNSLARMWIDMYGCSLIYDPEKSKFEMLRTMAEKYNADAVILAMMKFCEPEEFDYPLLKRHLDQYDIPLLNIEVDQQMQFAEQLRTRLQSFVEILESQKAAKV